MKNTRTTYKSIGAVAVVLLCLSAMLAEAGNLYRYRNSDGNLVIDHQVPPEYIAQGYEVITSTGRVEAVIPPHQEAGEEIPAEVAKKVVQDREEDQMLLRSYSTVEELQAASERRLQQLDREIEIVESNLQKNSRQLIDFRERAAMDQFNGEKLSDNLLKSLNGVEMAQRDAQQVLELRQKEREEMALRYQRYVERFKVLTAKSPDE
ncbi:MAG: hypothetical protein EP323_07475 [Gammaproteobacteria bacterium]|nr:MAG: hypothetical protein EP323_07475 [Gammaproteobacteria bacterium]